MVLLFLLGIDVGGNEAIIKGLHTLGLEALYYHTGGSDRQYTLAHGDSGTYYI